MERKITFVLTRSFSLGLCLSLCEGRGEGASLSIQLGSYNFFSYAAEHFSICYINAVSRMTQIRRFTDSSCGPVLQKIHECLLLYIGQGFHFSCFFSPNSQSLMVTKIIELNSLNNTSQYFCCAK